MKKTIIFTIVFLLMSSLAMAGKNHIRMKKRASVGLDLTWNGLAGLGALMSYHITEQLSGDVGIGLSGVGLKTGVRARYNFTTASFTPFVGLGAMMGGGTAGRSIEMEDNENGNKIEVQLEESYFIQTVLGFDYISDGGFMLLGQLGYANLIGDDNVKVVSGIPNDTQKAVIDITYKSGLVLGFVIGYAF